ncbi:Succinate--hydroxymethylglutarate CoA-transferase [Blattella germanica]|nr:Succinate--hydroxymethylglutarate CoA-transferase [Blattella germanica]
MLGVRLLKRCFSRREFVSVKHDDWCQIIRPKPYNSRYFSSGTSEIPKTDNSPLAGVRILDLTRIVAGPFCTMTLGDLGAEVIKIEMPGSGDETRKWGPPYITNSSETVYFISLNRNKKSVCINLKSGRDIIYDLAAKCDVLIENYIPGKLDELGLGYEDIKKVAPQIVYCSLTGYGTKGPYANRPGYDVIASSVGGLLHITGPEGGEPCKVGVAMVDMSTGLYAHGAILAALLQRTQTGRGQKIDCNLLSTQISTLIYVGANYLNAGVETKRRGTAHASIVPYQAFKTSDGEYLTIGAGSDQQFRALCEKLSLKELASDEKYVTNKLRVENRDQLLKILSEHFQKRSMSEWLKILDGSPFPYGPVNSIEKLVKEMQHPTAGTVKVVGPPVVFSEGQNEVRLPPPTLGQHTDEVLRNVLQYPADKISELRSKGIVQ